MCKANWYAVYIRTGYAKKVLHNLSKRNIETYYPASKASVLSKNGTDTVTNPLFPSYVFVRISTGRLREVQRIEGVINFLYWLDKPVIIRDVEIEMLRRFLLVHPCVHLEKIAVDIQEIVRFTKEPALKQVGGEGRRVDQIQLSLPSLGYALVAEAAIEVEKPHVPETAPLFTAAVKESYGLGLLNV